MHLRDQIGVPQTVVLAVELGAAAVLAGIRAGRCWIAGSAGTTLSLTARSGDRAAGIGERLTTDGRAVVVRLEIAGVPSGAVTFHTERGRAHHDLLPPAGAGSIGWSTSAAESAFVRAEVRDRAGDMAALTNPVILT